MVNLFNTNIAGILNSSIQSVGGVERGILVKTTKTRDANNPDRVNETPVQYPFQGTYEIAQVRGENLKPYSQAKIFILGDSLPAGIQPADGDKIVMRSRTLVIERFQADPAEAEYECFMQN